MGVLGFGLWAQDYARVVCLVRRQLAGLSFKKPVVVIYQLDGDTKEITETMTV